MRLFEFILLCYFSLRVATIFNAIFRIIPPTWPHNLYATSELYIWWEHKKSDSICSCYIAQLFWANTNLRFDNISWVHFVLLLYFCIILDLIQYGKVVTQRKLSETKSNKGSVHCEYPNIYLQDGRFDDTSFSSLNLNNFFIDLSVKY